MGALLRAPPRTPRAAAATTAPARGTSRRVGAARCSTGAAQAAVRCVALAAAAAAAREEERGWALRPVRARLGGAALLRTLIDNIWEVLTRRSAQWALKAAEAGGWTAAAVGVTCVPPVALPCNHTLWACGARSAVQPAAGRLPAPARRALRGGAVQGDAISKPGLKARLWLQRLKLKSDEPLSNFAFNYNLRHLMKVLSQSRAVLSLRGGAVQVDPGLEAVDPTLAFNA